MHINKLKCCVVRKTIKVVTLMFTNANLMLQAYALLAKSKVTFSYILLAYVQK